MPVPIATTVHPRIWLVIRISSFIFCCFKNANHEQESAGGKMPVPIATTVRPRILFVIRISPFIFCSLENANHKQESGVGKCQCRSQRVATFLFSS